MPNIAKVEFLDDKAVVHYNLGKPNGIADVHDAVIEIPYDPDHKIPLVPQARLLDPHFSHYEEVDIQGKPVVFVFDSYQENATGPNEEDIHGPYRKRDGSVECFWWKELGDGPTDIAHVIREVIEAENGKVFSAYCGSETHLSYREPNVVEPEFGTILDVKGIGKPVCMDCQELASARIDYARRLISMINGGTNPELIDKHRRYEMERLNRRE